MSKHRSFTLRKFYALIPPALFQEYFDRLQTKARPGDWAPLNLPAFEEFLDEGTNAEAAGLILEDLQRVNDVCVNDGAFVHEACRKFGVADDGGHGAEELAMELFLRNLDAFDYAWSMYLRLALPSRLCEYYFPAGELHPAREQIENLAMFLRGWFANMKKGHQCLIACFEDAQGLLIRVSRGARIKTVARWRGNEIDFECFRPASEDIISYDAAGGRLGIKASLKRDREQYLSAFAQAIAGDETLAERALKSRVFSLEPFQKDTFDYRGDGVISRIVMIEASLRVPTLTQPVVVVRSDDVRLTLKGEIEGLSLRDSELVRVKLRAELRAEGDRRPREVVFEIEPPGYSDLAQKAYAKVIEGYLRSQRVKLI